MMPRRAVAVSFLGGALAHIVFWLLVINLDSTPLDMACGEISCWVLFFAEYPVSLAYISGTAEKVTLGSFLAGSVYWGMVVCFAFMLVLTVRKAIRGKNIEP